MKNFTQISDGAIRAIWYAPQDNDEQVTITPDWYEHNGTPQSNNGEDMVYSHTEISFPTLADNTRLKERLDQVRNAAKLSEMFYTPETREDMDAWLKNTPPTSPTGIAVMVGYNYAIRQIQKIMDGTHEFMIAADEIETDDPELEGKDDAHA